MAKTKYSNSQNEMKKMEIFAKNCFFPFQKELVDQSNGWNVGTGEDTQNKSPCDDGDYRRVQS